VSVIAYGERKALKDALPPLGKLTMWLWAWGLMMLLTLFVRAMFGTVTGAIGWIPFAGSIVTRPIHKIEQKVSHLIGGAVAPIDAHIATNFHRLAAIVRGIPSQLVDDAGLIFGLAAALVVLPSKALVQWMIHWRVQPITSLVHTQAKTLHRHDAQTKALSHSVAQGVYPRLKVGDNTLGRVITRDLPALRAGELTLEREFVNLRKWIAARKVSLTTGAFIGASVWALGKLGLGWIRCSNWKRAGRSICGLNASIFEALLADLLILLSAFSIVEFAVVMQEFVGLMDKALKQGITEFGKLSQSTSGLSGKTPPYPTA
jgi:hypothetical protein